MDIVKTGKKARGAYRVVRRRTLTFLNAGRRGSWLAMSASRLSGQVMELLLRAREQEVVVLEDLMAELVASPLRQQCLGGTKEFFHAFGLVLSNASHR